MAGLPAAAASAAAQAVEAAGATLASGSSSSSLLVFLVPIFFPPSFLLLLFLAFVVLFAVSVLLRYLTILHARRQQQILRATAAALPSLPGSFLGAESVCLPGKRPFVVEGLSLLAALTKDAAWNVLQKMVLLVYAVLFFCFSWEERGLPASLARQRITPSEADFIERRTVIFIRHGESVWNATFNRPMLSLSFPLRFFLFWFWELFLTPERDSILFDSPLSTLGIAQAAELRSALRSSSSTSHSQTRRVPTWTLALIELTSVCAHAAVSSRGDEGGTTGGNLKQHCEGPDLTFKGVDGESVGNDVSGTQARTEVEKTSGKSFTSDAPNAVVLDSPEFSPRRGRHDEQTSSRHADRRTENSAQAGPSRTADASSSQASKAVEDRDAVSFRQKSDDGITRRDKTVVGKNRTGVNSALSALESKGLEAAPAAGEGIVLVSSNLRRSISTLLIALGPSVQSQRVQILSSLQESTRFPDALSLSSSSSFSRKPTPPPLSQLEETVLGASLEQLYASHLDQTHNSGNKRLHTTLAGRLLAFASWLFNNEGDGPGPVRAFIVVGHSRWLRYFFRMYYPADQYFHAKDKKLTNCGVLRFDVLKLRQKGSGRVDYYIDPQSCQLLRGNFTA
ncbi:phosphoglycerate mutase family protein [Cystoisospora suis]|uniref:Phosphoglycerate mutase family protein n=1 Tax=Cystoisospora suis TaxID=483139 RepID=A0A2C6KK76_9APIC|nr:phosphoglycerate mutase family protein [Cystoisospora suis]